MFLKEKIDGTIKGRIIVVENKQREFISKEDSSSPPVATEDVLVSCITDVEEEREVSVIDTPNAFIQTQVDNENERTVINIRGFIVELLLDIDPDFYGTLVTTDKKGEKVIILK